MKTQEASAIRARFVPILFEFQVKACVNAPLWYKLTFLAAFWRFRF